MGQAVQAGLKGFTSTNDKATKWEPLVACVAKIVETFGYSEYNNKINDEPPKLPFSLSQSYFSLMVITLHIF